MGQKGKAISTAAVLELNSPPMTPPMYPEAALPFENQLHACALDIRTGRINTVADLERIWQLGNEITVGPGEIYANHGSPIDPLDAELVWNVRTLHAWTLSEEEVLGLQGFQRMFGGTIDPLDPNVPLRYLQGDADTPSRVMQAHEWIGRTLGLANPFMYSFGQLADMAGNRLKLHDDILQGGAGHLADDVPVDDPLAPRIFSAAPSVEAASDREPLPALGVSGQESVNARNGDIDPTTKFRGVVRSHRMHERRRGLRLGLAALAVGAIALTALLVPAALHKPKETSPAAGPAQPVPVQVEEVPAQEATPPPPHPDTLERIVPIGSYDSEARTGAIWFHVEDYAAELGQPNLTMLQVHRLTQKTLDYMDTRLPDGMNWSKALEIRPGTQLPYPPAETMRAWITEVTAT